MKKLILLTVVATASLALAGVASAATATLFGSATVEGDHVKIVSDTAVPSTPVDDFGGVTFGGTGVTDFNSLTTLQAEYNVTDDACKGGAPRFEIDFAGTTNNLFVYLGTHNATTGEFDCAANTWLDSGNLITSTDVRFDTSKFAGGTFYDTYAHAKTLLGTTAIEAIRFVVDGGWSLTDKEQTVLLRKATVNTSVFTWTTPVTPPTGLNPAWTCKTFKAQHPTEFAAMFGTDANAYGKCVSHFAKTRSDAVAAAKVACKSVKTAKAKAKCVAAKSKAKYNAHARALTAATVACTAEKTANAAAFTTKYGTGKTHKNAYANCVRVKLRQ
jgi:hypothetical protein